MGQIVLIFFWGNIALLVYPWLLYPLFLLASRFIYHRPFQEKSEINKLPLITILLTVRNEEHKVERRIHNLLDTDYPIDKLEILVASDGSTDKTNDIVKRMAHDYPRIKLHIASGGGKSQAQNEALPLANGTLIILTDADAMFKKNTLTALVQEFDSSDVGCATGNLVLDPSANAISGGQGVYWRFEIWLRRLESRIGFLHTASGQIMAFRKSLFRPFSGNYGDDCVIPLDIKIQGYRVVHVENAIAYDTFPSTIKGEFRARTRMTLRNMTCTMSKLFNADMFKSPGLMLAIISHKILRWLTPYFMLGLFISNVMLSRESDFYLVILGAQVAFYALGLIGFIAERNQKRIPVASQIFSFLLANFGFFLGVMKALLGHNVTTYKNIKGCAGG